MRARLVLLGSGPSSGVPLLRCLLQPELGCKVCPSAQDSGSKNRRGTPSLLLQLERPDRSWGNVIIDTGKSFYEAAARFFPSLGVKGLDALIFTHGHADAILGLDSVREVQLASLPPTEWTIKDPLSVHASQKTLSEIQNTFGYMFSGDYDTLVGKLVAQPFDLLPSFDVCDLTFTPLPVEHGRGYTCYGFMFGDAERVVYLSDVSDVPAETYSLISAKPLSLLFVDCLMRTIRRPSHFSLEQALELVRKLRQVSTSVTVTSYRPARTVLVGLSCEFDYEELKRECAALKHEVRRAADCPSLHAGGPYCRTWI